MKKAVIYARYSSSAQTEQSIEGQLRVCNKYAQENNFVILNEYIDRAKTGRNDNRPSFQKMLKDSEREEFEFVIVYSLDRFGRNDADYGANKKLLANHNVKILSATEITSYNADGTDNLGGILTEGVLVAVATYFSKELAKKVKRGMDETIAKGNFIGGSVPFGFMVENKKLIPNPTTAPKVKEMFERFSKGEHLKEILTEFNSQGYTNTQGRKLLYNTIFNQMKNPIYYGHLSWSDYEIDDYTEKIVSKELWDEVQERMSNNKLKPRQKKYKYILSGKLYLSDGTALTGRNSYNRTHTEYNYYSDGVHTYRADVLENIVLDKAMSYIRDENIRKILSKAVLEALEPNNDELEETLAQLKKLNTELDRAKRLSLKLDNPDEMADIINEKRTQIEQLEIERSKLEFKKEVPITEKEINMFLDEFLLKNPEDEKTKKYLIDYLINKVILYEDKLVIIYNNSKDNYSEMSFEDINVCINTTWYTIIGQIQTIPLKHYTICIYPQIKTPSRSNLVS